MQVKLVAVTKGVEQLDGHSAQDVMSFITRVSNPSNQANFDTAPKLLGYCIKNSHWSPFEHAYMTLEIKTSRAIAAQILRHRSFTFQEFSQRYAIAVDAEIYEARRQDVKNRQNSIDDMPEDVKSWFKDAQDALFGTCYSYYKQALDYGIAKECARFLLPLSTGTTIYMSGSVRSWIHYIQLRTDKSTQLEHREIADECKRIFIKEFPDIALALDWKL